MYSQEVHNGTTTGAPRKMIERNEATTEYTDYHRKAINVLSWLSVSLTVVTVDEKGKFVIKAGHWIGKFLYIFVTLNTIVKLIYLLLLVNGCYGPVEFLDKMSALLWILMGGEICQELNIYTRRYPLYEILAELWKTENEIYDNLGKPSELKKKLDRINWRTVFIHTTICVVGDSFMVIQFLAAPKYSCYTYAAFTGENNFLLVVFAVHEFLFIWHAWNGYVSVVCLSSINAAELTYTVEAMTETLNSLQDISPRGKDKDEHNKLTTKRRNQNHKEQKELNEMMMLEPIAEQRKVLDPKHIAEGTKYDILTLLFDYRRLMLVSDQLNAWCSYKIVGVHTIGYCQFISDVFMMMQLLKLPDFDFVAVLWFFEDSSACILMMLRMFTIMSRVTPASENFITAFRHYLAFENPLRKQLKRVLKTFRLVCVKLGPCPVTPGTVGGAMNMLLGYYICVALWPDT